jgi:Protein of unknown function (DUF2917)
MGMVQQISRNQSISVAARRGMTVRVARGRVWLTRDGDARDYVLSAGDSMNLEATCQVVLFGLTAAFVQVDTPARAPGVWSRFFARLSWMGEQT